MLRVSTNTTALVNGVRSRSVWTPASEHAIAAAVDREQCSSRDISWEWDGTSRGSFKCYVMINWMRILLAESSFVCRQMPATPIATVTMRIALFDHGHMCIES